VAWKTESVILYNMVDSTEKEALLGDGRGFQHGEEKKERVREQEAWDIMCMCVCLGEIMCVYKWKRERGKELEWERECVKVR